MTDLSSLFPQGVGNITTDNDITGDGGAKKAQECSTITVDDSGRMVNTGQPAFLVKPAVSQESIDNAAQITVDFGTEIKDQGNNYASNLFTAPVTGMYQFNASVELSNCATDADYYWINLITSNREYTCVCGLNVFSVDNEYMSLSLSVLADMDVNDTAYITVYQNGGTQQTDISTRSFFSGHLVC